MLTFHPKPLRRRNDPRFPLYLLHPSIASLEPLFDSPDCILWTGATKNKTPVLQIHNHHIPVYRIIHDWQHVETSQLKIRFHPCQHSRLCIHPDHLMVSVRPTAYNLAFHTLVSEQGDTLEGREEPVSRGSSQDPPKPVLTPSDALFEELLDLYHDLPDAMTSITAIHILQNEGRPPSAFDNQNEILRAMVSICNSRPHIRSSLPDSLLTEIKEYLT